MTNFKKIAENAKIASKQLALASTGLKNSALEAIAKALVSNKDVILKASLKQSR